MQMHGLIQFWKKATEAGIDVCDTALISADIAHLSHDAELALARKIAEWPRLLELAAKHNEPHRVAFYSLRIGL